MAGRQQVERAKSAVRKWSATLAARLAAKNKVAEEVQ